MDSGLADVHKWLSQSGHHFGIKALTQLLPGSHGVWEKHAPIMPYKLVIAAKECGLSLLMFEFGQKSACVASPHPLLTQPLVVLFGVTRFALVQCPACITL